MKDSNDFRNSPLLSICESAFEGIAIAEWSTNRIVYANATLCTWLEIPRASADSTIAVGDILKLSDAAPQQEIAAMLETAETHGSIFLAQLPVRGLASKPVEVRVCRIPSEGERLYGVLLMAVEAASVGTQDESSLRLDPLTGLRDRAFLFSRLAELLGGDRAADNQFAVLFVDLDNFKYVNDAYGHLVGDSVLREVAQRLTSCMRAHDHVVRFGGDEFVVLAEQLATLSDIDSIVRRIHGVLERPIMLPHGKINLTLSIGVAEALADYRSPEDVLAAADRAMYASKRSSS